MYTRKVVSLPPAAQLLREYLADRELQSVLEYLGVELTEHLKQRFWSHVLIIDDEDSCWLWDGALNHRGYGVFQLAKKIAVRANRFSYILARGVIPSALFVLHTCDNPPCVRPNHLYVGTQSRNVLDARDRGRWPKCKLTRETSNLMKKLHVEGTPKRDLAALFEVDRSTVSRVVNGVSWA